MIDYTLILSKNYVGKKWILNGDSYDGLNWLDELPKPTKEELDSQWSVIQTNMAANAYKAQRASEYPSIPDQLDLLYHGGMDAWKAAIQVVKDKYPKGTA